MFICVCTIIESIKLISSENICFLKKTYFYVNKNQRL